tara:strand:+ start:493 stop:651 length:159 start_codon:yes stop_codon:yes gene_type:complete
VGSPQARNVTCLSPLQVAGAITSLQPAATIVEEMMRQAVQVMRSNAGMLSKL